MQQDVSSPHWVERRHPRSGDLCPLYPRKWTLIERVAMSALCQKRPLLRRNGMTQRASFDPRAVK